MEPTIQKPAMTPKFFFVSLGVIITLITSVSSLLILFFETLNKKFPDVLNSTYQYGYNTSSFDAIRGSLATLIIVFPVFLILSHFWRKWSKEELGRIDALVRRWMIYLILFLASIVIIVDLVTLVQYFVAGEITNRFIYKVVGTIIVAGLVGEYYFVLDIWRRWESKKKMLGIIYGAFAIILVVGAIVYSFSIMGSPAKQRALRFDERRVTDLQNIQYQIINYWQQKEKLPAELKDIASPLSGYSLPVDPEIEEGKVYEYKPTGKLSFELCATFLLPMPKGWQEYNYGGGIRPMMPVSEVGTDVAISSYPYPFPSGTNDSWDHQTGRTCFERTIDKDLYPPYPKVLKN